MIYGHGIDIQSIKRTNILISKYGNLLESMIFTKNEWRIINNHGSKSFIASLFFSIKESVSKALGTGFHDFEFTDIEIFEDFKIQISNTTLKEGYEIIFSYSVLEDNVFTSVIIEV